MLDRLSSHYPTGSVRAGATLHNTEIQDYVAQLQLHMTLQARNLIPGLEVQSAGDSRMQLLRQTQADLEKSASRQWFG